MNLQQLEYIIAVDSHRHFVKAAEKCFVTQATLSMMIKKLEEELEVKIFDRSKQPVVPTETGEKIIAQAKRILAESHKLKEIVQQEAGTLKGELRIGIIPTLAPYLLPLFLETFLERYPEVRLIISELTTDEIVNRLMQNQLDAGLLAIPVGNEAIHEESLFYEEFVVYAPEHDTILKKKYILPADIDISRLWLLEEGHCLRNQVINLCELKVHERAIHQLDFSAASLETLKKIVEINKGITILPWLGMQDLSPEQKSSIRYFRSPVPVRQIGLVRYRYFVKEQLLAAFREEILIHIPERLRSKSKKEVIGIHQP